jgi:phosphoglycolate phosphatase-like HAD superfamily hydrolase
MKAIIIDLDGTLCNVQHRVHFVKEQPPNWPAFFDACVDDTPNAAICALIEMARDAGIAVIYVSGRPDSHRAQTDAWLARHFLDEHIELLMRTEGDYRPDQVVKRELYEAHIAGQHTILFCVDDRNQVVCMWRDLGLTCLQCAEGDF